MQGQITEMFQDINPNNRNAEWFNKYITLFRMTWGNLVDPIRCRHNKQIILSQQSMQPIIDTFKDTEFRKNTKWEQLGVWNRILNIIVEEITKNPPQCELRAEDSQALSDRKEDILLLRHKHILENDLNSIGSKIGEPAEIVGADKFKGNIDEFQRLDLDPNDPEDITFYENSGFQRLRYEIAGQNLINTIMKLNRFDEDTIRKFVIDILAVLVICMDAYVDAITGEIKYRYIFPEEAMGIFGNSEDGSDDICKGYQRSSTIREWLGSVGNAFDWDKNWRQMLGAINYRNGFVYTGFVKNNIQYDCYGNSEWSKEAGLSSLNNGFGVTGSSLLNWNEAYNYRVFTGKIQWSVMEATATYLAKHSNDELMPGIIDFDTELKSKKETREYYKESFYQEQMYESYFLATGFSSQFIYKFGKLYYTQLTGAFDEVAKGTLMFYRLEGKSAAEISEPYIEVCNLAFYRMKWLLSKVKPPDDEYQFEELIQASKGFKKEFTQTSTASNLAVNPQQILDQVIQYQRQNSVKLRFYPQVDGKTIPQVPSFPEKRSKEEFLATQMIVIEDWGENQVAVKVGLNDMRLGQVENAREGYKTNVAETQSSLNSTGYIYRMIQYLKQHKATITCNYAQDIVKFKDSIPYKYLLKLLGEDDFENLKLLGDFAQHRYGIVVDDYNAGMERKMLIDAAYRSLDSGDGRGGITVMQFGILLMTKDYKKLFRLWDYYKYKAEKKKRAQELQTLQIQQQNAMQLEQARQQTEQMKGQLAITKEQIAADGYKYAADRQYQAKVDVKQIGISGETQKIIQKTEAEKQIAENNATIALQESLTP